MFRLTPSTATVSPYRLFRPLIARTVGRVSTAAATAAAVVGARFGAAFESAASDMVSPLCETPDAPSAASRARSSSGSVLWGRVCSELTPLTYQYKRSCEPLMTLRGGSGRLRKSCEEHNDPTTTCVNPCPRPGAPGTLAEA